MSRDVGVLFRDATEADVPTMVALLAHDPLGSQREDPGQRDLGSYRDAFAAIQDDPNHRLIVAESESRVVGMLQLSILPHLTYEGGWRAQIEGVRVAEEMRSRGVGRVLLTHAIDAARERGCHLVQLTTDKRRPEALRFYRELGFEATHEGMKLHF